MEGLRYQARRTFLSAQKHRPQPLGKSIPLITVRKSSSGDTHVKSEDVRPIELIQQATQPVSRGEDEAGFASLRIAQIEGDSDQVICLDGTTFLDLYQTFDLEPCWLALLQSSVYGFHHLESPPASKGNNLLQFYLKTVNYTFIWSHNVADKSTNGIMISGIVYSRQYHELVDTEFVHTVNVHKDLIDDPRFCSLISAIGLNNYINDGLLEQLYGIRNVEMGTEHGTWATSEQNDLPTTQKLTKLSKETGFCLSNLANLTQHVLVANDLLQSFSSPVARSNAISDSGIDEAVAFLVYQIDGAQNSISCQQERGRTQLSIIFNLLGREDANASHEIAAAAKQDTSAMKTIAVMTMAFLPGTFLAALFAVPFLHWDAERIVSDRFWIYWAFTLPFTGLVFLVWWLIGFKKRAADSSDGGSGGSREDAQEPETEKSFGKRLNTELSTFLRKRRSGKGG